MTDAQIKKIFFLMKEKNFIRNANYRDIVNFKPIPTEMQRNGAWTPFEAFIAYLKGELEDLSMDVPEDVLRLAVALYLLNYPQVEPPPVEIWQPLLNRVRQEIPKAPERILEYAIAYGCGLWRQKALLQDTHSSHSWFGRWNNALKALARLYIDPPIRQVQRYLRNRIRRLEQTFGGGENEFREIHPDAERLALILLKPVREVVLSQDQPLSIETHSDNAALGQSNRKPLDDFNIRINCPGRDEPLELMPGERYVFTIKQGEAKFTLPNSQTLWVRPGDKFNVRVNDEDIKFQYASSEGSNRRWELKPGQTARLSGSVTLQEWTCTSGTKDFETVHNFYQWSLTEYSLREWIAQAVFGNAKTQKLEDRNVKNFVSGLYYSYLASSQDGFFIEDSQWRLREVSTERVENPIPDLLFNQIRNLWDREIVDPSQHRWRLVDTHLVLVKTRESVPLHYQRQPRYKCSDEACKNLFEIRFDRCPLGTCGKLKPQRPTYVYVRDPMILQDIPGDGAHNEFDRVVYEDWNQAQHNHMDTEDDEIE